MVMLVTVFMPMCMPKVGMIMPMIMTMPVTDKRHHDYHYDESHHDGEYFDETQMAIPANESLIVGVFFCLLYFPFRLRLDLPISPI